MTWLTLIGSLAAVFAVAGLVWAMGMGRGAAITDSEAAERLAREAQSGFVPHAAIVGRDHRAALVLGADEAIILLRVHGAQIAARVLRSLTQVERRDGVLIIGTGERLFGDVILDLGADQARHWEAVLGDRMLETAHG